MSYGSRTISYKRMNLLREECAQIMIQVYKQSESYIHYEIYPASLRYREHGGEFAEYSSYEPTYWSDRTGCLRQDTFQKLVRNGILVDKTPDKTRACYRYYAFPETEITLY